MKGKQKMLEMDARAKARPKAILELEMPISCGQCPCSWRMKDDIMICEVIMHYCPEKGRHKYCPLKLVDKEVE